MMEIENIKIMDIFDELFYPIFFSYHATIFEKEKIVVSIFAHYDEETETDFFLNAIVNKNTYDRLIKGDIEIRGIFANNTRNVFRTKGSPYDFKEMSSIKLDVELEKMLPDHNLYLVRENEGFSIVDYEEIKKELKTNQVLVEQFLSSKPSVKEQILHYSSKQEEGLLIAFSNDVDKYTIEIIGKLMEKTGALFNKITKGKFNLDVNHPFQSSFGISLDIDSKNKIGESNEYIGRFMDILKFVSNSEDISKSFLNLYEKKEKKELLSILKVLKINKIDMSTVYYNFRQREEKIDISQITSNNAEYFLNNNLKDEIIESQIHLKNVEIYKIDTKKNSFGLIDIDTNKTYNGVIESEFKQNTNRIYKVPSRASVDIIIRKTIESFVGNQKTEYILENLINHE